MIDRISMIRTLFDPSGVGLEIGPSYRPIAPKKGGFKVEILDHASSDEMRLKYGNEPNVDPSLIEDVDFVWRGETLLKTVNKERHYDYIIASHVIEHIPDLLGFVQDCDALLQNEGVLVLAVPDRRRCFDLFRPNSTTGEVMQAHHEKRKVHAPATAFDHIANMVTLSGLGVWNDGDTGPIDVLYDLEFAKWAFDRSAAGTDYFDFHAWMFSPSSFRLIMDDLFKIGAISLREARVVLPDNEEFIVTMSRSGQGPGLSRLDLMRRVASETTFPDAGGRAGEP